MPVIRTATTTVPVTIRHSAIGGFQGCIPVAASASSGYWTIPFAQQQQPPTRHFLSNLLRPFGSLDYTPNDAPNRWVIAGSYDMTADGLLDFDILIDGVVVLTFTGDVTTGQNVSAQLEVPLTGTERFEVRARSIPGMSAQEMNQSGSSAASPGAEA